MRLHFWNNGSQPWMHIRITERALWWQCVYQLCSLPHRSADPTGLGWDPLMIGFLRHSPSPLHVAPKWRKHWLFIVVQMPAPSTESNWKQIENQKWRPHGLPQTFMLGSSLPRCKKTTMVKENSEPISTLRQAPQDSKTLGLWSKFVFCPLHQRAPPEPCNHLKTQRLGGRQENGDVQIHTCHHLRHRNLSLEENQ